MTDLRTEVNIWLKDKNWDMLVTELVPWKYYDLVQGRVFESLKEAEELFLALNRGASGYALTHGMACPADTKRAIEKIKEKPIYGRRNNEI